MKAKDHLPRQLTHKLFLRNTHSRIWYKNTQWFEEEKVQTAELLVFHCRNTWTKEKTAGGFEKNWEKKVPYNRNLHNIFVRLDNSICKNKTRSIKRQQEQRYNISAKRENLNISFYFALVHIPRIKMNIHAPKQKHSRRSKKIQLILL